MQDLIGCRRLARFLAKDEVQKLSKIKHDDSYSDGIIVDDEQNRPTGALWL